MTTQGIICAGNWIVDIVHQIDHWPRESDLARIAGQDMDIGGGAANVVAALTRMETGLPLWPMGAIGGDDYGQFILRRCAELGLPTDLLCVKPGVPTAHTHVMSVSGQSRTFFYQGGANDVLAPGDFDPALLQSRGARIFYLGYLTLLAELDRMTGTGTTGAATVLDRARAAGMITCVDLVSVDRPDLQPGLMAALGAVDYLILNEIELARACRQPPPPPEAELDQGLLTAMAQELIMAGVRRAVIIHYPRAALWVGTDGQQVTAPVMPLPRAEIASPLGAGDAFCAGILYALHARWSPDRALALGHAVARASLRGINASAAVPPLRDLTDQNGRHLLSAPS